jgi:hypothetical protein
LAADFEATSEVMLSDLVEFGARRCEFPTIFAVALKPFGLWKFTLCKTFRNLETTGSRVVKESEPSDPKVRLKSRILRERSMPPNRGFRMAALLSLLHYFTLLGAILTGIAVYWMRGRISEMWIGVAVGFVLVTWFIAYLKRRSAICPLCRGMPLVDSQARVNVRAQRFLGFNHGVTAILSILATQTFRCMYCGSKFDLLKRPSYRTQEKTKRR